MLGRRINFYRKSSISLDNYDKINAEYPLTLPGGLKLPLSWLKTTYTSREITQSTFSKKRAQAYLKQRLEADIQTVVGEGEVLSKEWKASERDGVLTVTLQASCNEEIGRTVELERESETGQAQEAKKPKTQEMNRVIEQSISLERMEDTASLFGPFDENIRLIERELHVQIVIREEELRISGEAEQVMYAEKTIQSLLALGARGEAINEQNIRYVLQLVLQGQEEKVNDLARDVVCVTAAGKPIKAKTVGQTAYVRAIQNNVVTLGVGPAGTGKTYLAVAMAVAAFKARQVNRIILTRPAVEAGERLGFLPGDLQSKVDRTSAPSTTPSLKCWGRRPTTNIWSGGTSRSHPWPICVAAPWTTPSSSWTRHRTPLGNR